MARIHIDPTLEPEAERSIARATSRALETRGSGKRACLRVQVSRARGPITTLDLPRSAERMIREILKEMASGRSLTLVADEAELSPQQAADLLLVSRPFVMDLIARGALPARKAGRQYRLVARDVLALRRDTEIQRARALRKLVAHDQKLGLI